MTRSFGFRFLVGGILRCCLSLACAAACAGTAVTQTDSKGPNTSALPAQMSPKQDVIKLELGKAIEHEIGGGQRDSYQIVLGQGEYGSVIVEQRGVDVVVKCIGTDGKLIAEFDSENRTSGEERAELAAAAPGSYRFDIEPKYKMLPRGRYQIRLAELRISTEKDRQLQEARELYTKAYYSIVAGKYDEAETMLETALSLRQKAMGTDHPDIAYSLTLMANIAYYKGDFQKAELLFQNAIAILEKTLGPDHPQVAMRLNNLASVYQVKTDFAKSETLHRRALDIRQHSLAPDHPDIAQSLNNLANVYIDRGDMQSAEPLLLQALAINEKILGPDHLNLSYPLTNLGSIYLETEEYDKAQRVLQRALDIREQKLDKNHPAVAMVLYNVAEVYKYKGDYDRAEEMHNRALAIKESKFGPDHPDVGRSLYFLANIYFYRGNYQKAEAFYLRALGIEEAALGSDHPLTLNIANHLAMLYMAAGDFPQAVRFQERAIVGTDRNIDLNLAIGSERQKQAYLAQLPEQVDRAISLNVALAVSDATARDLALTTILRRKGRVLDAMSNSFAALHDRMDTRDQPLLDQLNQVTSQLARLVLYGPQRMTPAEHKKEIDTLESSREKLEGEISRRSAGFYRPTQPVGLSSIQSAIPQNAALIEFAVYRPFDPKRDDAKAYGEPRYVAYVVRTQGEVRWKELGPAKEIDGAINALRQALRDPQRKDARRLARSLDERIMRPVRAALGSATFLLVSPDGELNLIPFEALVDEQGHYLVEHYSISYLTTGRDLMRMQVPRTSQSEPLVIANPSFGESTVHSEPGDGPVAEAAYTKSRRPIGGARRSITAAQDLSGVYFAPLPGSAQEALAIQSLFPGAKLLTGRQATGSAFKQVHAPRLLHIATHGFFLEDAAKSPSHDAAKREGIQPGVKVGNPLLRSGLALAGANLGNGRSNSGIITALEASSLNLWGTKLVTLSACDTGVGEVRNGEGVYGLRRAFFLAGTETLVMSLWPVSDRVTREIMTAYYTGLKQGLGRGEALRQAELAMLKRKDRQHPFYWASFIQSGEWASLDGRR